MGLFDSFLAGYRAARTEGPAVLSISRLELRPHGPGLLVCYDLEVGTWHGWPLATWIEILDGDTGRVTHSVTASIGPNPPCWNTTISNARLELDDVPAAHCAARMSIFEGSMRLTTCTSEPLTRAIPITQPLPLGAPSSHAQRMQPPTPTPEEAQLGLKPGYTEAELKSAFRRAIREWHPDRFVRGTHRQRDTAAAQTRGILEAYAVLAQRMGVRAS